MNNLNFQNESPSGVDAFKGESHDRVAQAMHNYIKNKSNYRVIGLDGEFGSGKSSILQMLEKKIVKEKSKTKLWVFDCEQNYQGSIKSNFIEVLSENVTFLLKELGRDKEISAVETNRDIALGRHYSYTKDTRSHISIWAVLLIASGVLAPTFIRDYLIRLHSDSPLTPWLHGLYLLACTAPGFILLLAYLASRKEKNPKKRWNLTSLLKGNSDDRITETVEVSKEVSPHDLKRALRSHLHAVKDHHIIIVIDNLDRLPRDALRSVWSDLEIFTSVTGQENLSVIVPFCSTKVSKYLNGDSEQTYDSKDFIAKKFPVVFRTPPIITSGWKDAFRTLWAETFGNSDLSEADACSVILQRHSPMAGGLVTPRLQKRFINDIATTLLVTADKPSVVCIAAYLAICKYNGVAIETMLKDPDAPNVEQEVASAAKVADTAAQAVILNVDKTKRTLKALLGEDMKTGWPIQILQIHFQTSTDIAIAELIDQPLEDAIDSQDGKKLATLIPYFGFKDSFIRRLEGAISASSLLKTLYQASMIEGCSVGDLLPQVSAKFITGDQLNAEKVDATYFESIRGLIALGLRKEIFTSALSTAKTSFEKMIEEAYDLDSVKAYREIISKYDSYLDSMDETFNPLVISSAELLFQMIMPEPDLKKIDASKITLDDSGLKDAVLQLASSEHENLDRIPLDEDDWLSCFTAHFSESKLSTDRRPYFMGKEQVASVTTAIALNPAEHRVWFAAALFDNLPTAITQLILQYLPTVESNQIKVSMAVIYMRLKSGVPLTEIPGIDEAFEAEQVYLDTLVRAATTSEHLFKLTLEDECSHLVAPILARLIKDKAVALVHADYLYEFYSTLADTLNGYDLTDTELLEWFTSFQLKAEQLPALSDIDTLFLSHVLGGSNAKLLELRAALLDRSFGGGINVAAWTKLIEGADTNERTALRYMLDHKIDFSGETFAHQAVSVLLTAAVKQTPFVKPSAASISNSKVLLDLFEKDTQAIIGTVLRPFLYDQKVTVEASVFILSEYSALLASITPRTPEEEERLLQILLQMHSDPEGTTAAKNFLDSKALQLAEWKISKEHKDTYTSLITKLKTSLPTIYANLSEQHGYRTRMKELAKSFFGKE
ncbi:P-loop NTPase fold protein [Pseudomonas sp. NFACC07-1]|uniref:P-loop NTPase fold protein n=1 Tax=Pseudomonas sp. NFACC07-1 TaxID=1566239 RepID=UPI0008CA7172|nr:P-loop NTPase fold protein [Pseudomonas sp. NFACC07-1]SEK03575.1 KAP family P-loop domain-containing protein [Pseudomonas sp. NFACC07-1]